MYIKYGINCTIGVNIMIVCMIWYLYMNLCVNVTSPPLHMRSIM